MVSITSAETDRKIFYTDFTSKAKEQFDNIVQKMHDIGVVELKIVLYSHTPIEKKLLALTSGHAVANLGRNPKFDEKLFQNLVLSKVFDFLQTEDACYAKITTTVIPADKPEGKTYNESLKEFLLIASVCEKHKFRGFIK